MSDFVCCNHIGDEAIKKYIKSHSHKGKCDYCTDTRDRNVIALDDLGEFMEESIRYYYDEAGNALGYISAEGGYIGSHFDTYDLLWDELGVEVEDAKLQNDLVRVLPDTVWCHRDPYGLNESEELFFDWKDFQHTVKHKARYSFFLMEKVKDFEIPNYSVNVSDILHEVGRLITCYNLIRKLPVGTIFFRCRQHKSVDEVSKPNDIASPPLECVTFSNRMSPAGIPMFYGGFDIETAIRETVDVSDIKKPYYTVGEFTSKNEIMVVDFSALPSRLSIFDTANRKHFYPINFLWNFVTDLSKTVSKDGKEHIEYVPTQVVTEYIRYILTKNSKSKVGGIIYPSAKFYKRKACVLFLNNEESLKELQLTSFAKKDEEVKRLDFFDF
jgi:hypothetical protein